jgi:hypothetical protein
VRLVGVALLLLIPGSLRQLAVVAVAWSAAMLFGRVPRTREPYLFVMTVGSLTWSVAVVGVIVPPVADFLLSLLPFPDAVEAMVAWYVMLVLAIVIPSVVAFAAMRSLNPEDRPREAAAVGAVLLKCYPYTASLALILLVMAALTVVTRLRSRGQGWVEKHVPLIVEPDDYDDVLGEIGKVLENGGLPVRAGPAGWFLRVPSRILMAIAGPAVKDLIAERLTVLRSDKLEIVLHLSDLVLRGRERDVNRVRALLSEQLAFSKAYLTWGEEANGLEDRLRAIWREVKDRTDGAIDSTATDRLAAVERELRTADLPYEEWEVLSREKLLIERNLLVVAAGLLRTPTDLTETAPENLDATRMDDAADSPPARTTARDDARILDGAPGGTHRSRV